MKRLEMAGLLSDLEKELRSGDAIDDYHQAKASALAGSIKDMLGKRSEELTGDEFLIKKLQESIDDFELKHPGLTNVVGRISDLLAGCGI